MKKVLVLLGALVAPMVVHAADKPLLLDQDVYERVFLECAKTFNGPQKTTFNDLDEALEVCRDTAKEIAVRQGTLKMAVGSNWEEVQVMEKPGYMVDLNAKLMREENRNKSEVKDGEARFVFSRVGFHLDNVSAAMQSTGQ